jgi:hypothetical protein
VELQHSRTFFCKNSPYRESGCVPVEGPSKLISHPQAHGKGQVEHFPKAARICRERKQQRLHRQGREKSKLLQCCRDITDRGQSLFYGLRHLVVLRIMGS